MGTIRVTAVVLSEVSITHTQATIYMMVLMTVVFTAVSLVSLFLWALATVKHTKWIKSLPWHMLREMNPSLLTCIWSSEEEMSGYEETGNPSADTSHPPEWHSLCLGNLCPFPGHRMLWHWHLCPHLSQSLAKEKRHRNCNDECKHEKEGIGKFAKERDVETKRQAGGEGEKEGDINPQKNVSCLT